MAALQQPPKKSLTIALVALSVVMTLALFATLRDRTELLSYDRYHQMLTTGSFTKAVVQGDKVFLSTAEGRYEVPREGIDLQELYHYIPYQIEEPIDWFDSILSLVAIVILILVAAVVIKAYRMRQQPSHSSSSHIAETSDPLGIAQVIRPMSSTVRFADVAGIGEVKAELMEIVDFLKNPGRYKKFGIKLPKGVLLVGPPGVGKTMIAKALAAEAGVPFFYQSGSSFVQIYVGVGAKRVRELFAAAKRSAPAIIFIDEIDAVGKARGGGRNDEREATLNQLLTEMDGFEDNSGVIVVAATNKIEMLDEALLRAGRFDRRIFISLPGFHERQEILAVHLSGRPHAVNLAAVARQTVGFSAAALANLVNEAAMLALKRGKEVITDDEMAAVREKVLIGTRKILSFSDSEKRVLAIYQAARLLLAYWYEIDFERVTLLGAGYKEVEREISSQSQLLSRIRFLLAGKAALTAFEHENYSLVVDDLARAKNLVTEIWERYGLALDQGGSPAELLLNLYKETQTLMERSKEQIDRIASKLYEDEEITRDEVVRIAHEVV